MDSQARTGLIERLAVLVPQGGAEFVPEQTPRAPQSRLVSDVRPEEPGLDDADLDPARAQFPAQPVREGLHAEFGDAVSGRVWETGAPWRVKS